MKKRKGGVRIEEHFDHDTEGSHNRRATPLKGPKGDVAEDCECRCCLKHSPPKPELIKMVCGHKKGGRNLIVCIDGTANQFGEKNTNVIELYNLVLKGTADNQLTWYNSGIGTYVRPAQWSFQNWMDHKTDEAFAWSIKKTVLEAYQWLSDNYQDGDCIFLFGFSRGAFQVRTLSGMIEKVGLIHKGNAAQIPFAYELYIDPKSGEPSGATEVGSGKGVSMAQRFKEAFSRKNVRVHFVGAWDTVSSIGVARGKRVLPLTADGMTHVCYFRHALALDERRVKFLPEYAWGGTTLPPSGPGTGDRVQPQTLGNSFLGTHSDSGPLPPSSGSVPTDRVQPHTSEVWFPGTHSDIGGGNVYNVTLDRSRPPLRWMASQAAEFGLRIGSFVRELLVEEQVQLRESLTLPWKIFELYPFRRLTYSRARINTTTRGLHLGAGRKIHAGQKIHYSFILGKTESPNYIPKARPADPSPTFWTDLRNEDLPGFAQWIETDVFYHAASAVTELLTSEGAAEGADARKHFEEIIKNPPGPQFLYEEVIETLRREPNLELSAKHLLLQTTIDAFQGRTSDLRLVRLSQVYISLKGLLRSTSPQHRKVAQDFQCQLTRDANCLLEFEGHTGLVRDVAISLDGKRIVSGSDDKTIRIWDVETGMCKGEPLGHRARVNSVAISQDGKRIVSGDADWMIRIWDAETVEQSGVLEGHTDEVWSVAISPDGRRIVSGSRDKTVRIWDPHTGGQFIEPLRGLMSGVTNVEISPDGERIVSRTDDGTIQIWNLYTGRPMGAPRRVPPMDWVNSGATSSNRKYVVSGGRGDGTIQVCRFETGEQVGEPLQGHTKVVTSVAISRDRKLIVSASADTTVRVWNAEGILV